MAKKKTSTARAALKTSTLEIPTSRKGRGGGRPRGQWVLLTKDALIQHRKGAGLSRAKLAEILDVSATSVQNWETGRAVPVKRLQERLAELVGGAPVAAGKSSAGREPLRPEPASSLGPVELQRARLSVTGEILKAYLTTSQGAKIAPGGLVALTESLRSALN